MKKGEGSLNIEVLFLLFGIIMAGFVMMFFLADIRENIELKTLQRNFIARDLALTINAIYASPGEITYNYSFPTEFVVDVENRVVGVRSEDDQVARARYPFVGDSNVRDFNFRSKGHTNPDSKLNLTFHKYKQGDHWVIDVTSHGLELDLQYIEPWQAE